MSKRTLSRGTGRLFSVFMGHILNQNIKETNSLLPRGGQASGQSDGPGAWTGHRGCRGGVERARQPLRQGPRRSGAVRKPDDVGHANLLQARPEQRSRDGAAQNSPPVRIFGPECVVDSASASHGRN